MSTIGKNERFIKSTTADNVGAMSTFYQRAFDLIGSPQAREAFEAYLKADANGPKAGEVKTFLQQLPK